MSAPVRIACPSCAAEVPGGARFCPSCGFGLGARTEERRIVTVLFADLVGYTAYAEGRDPEQVKNLVDGCFERLVADVVAYGGRVDKIMGDAIVALFGAPVAHEDDAERAVRAALHMQSTLAAHAEEQGVDVRMRIGINTGEVLVGALRAGGDYTAMGDVVNTASRLQTAAQPGQVLVGPATYEATSNVVRYERLGELQTRGREAPVDAAAAIETVVPPGYRPRRVRTPLIGRDVEITMLRGALSSTWARQRLHVALLSGDAGTGKTRLAEELGEIARRDHGALVLEGRCVPYGEANVWFPLAEALRQACGIDASDTVDVMREKGLDAVMKATGLDRDDPETERLVAGIDWLMGHEELLGDVEPSRARDEAVRALQRCIEGIASSRPVVIVLAELHWADDLLLDLLDRLVDRLRGVPLMLLGTTRPGLEERWRPSASGTNVLVVHLDPLDEAATARLLDELVEGGLSPDVRDLLVERSGGNPLFLEELVALVIEDPSSLLPDHGGHAGHGAHGTQSHGELPATLRGLVAARLDGLAPLERSVLDDAAVIGRGGPHRRLEALAEARTGAADVSHAIKALVAKDLLVLRAPADGVEESWEFRSELVREVAYGMLTKGERARRHALLARWLAERGRELGREEEELEQLAHHYGVAAELVGELGGRVDGVPSTVGVEALDVLERAIKRSQAAEQWGVVAHLASHALRLAGSVPGGGDRRLELLLRRARARTALHDLTGAHADVDAVLAESGVEHPTGAPARQRALTILGEVERIEGNVDASVATLTNAAEGWRAIGDEQGEADALRALGLSEQFRGRLVEAEEAVRRALDAYRTLGDRQGEAWALQQLAWIAFNQNDSEVAKQRLERSAATFAEIRDWGGQSWALGLLAWVHFTQGDRVRAEELASKIVQDAQGSGEKWAPALMTTLLANCRLWDGSPREAIELADRSRHTLQDLGDRWALLQALIPLGRGLVLAGDIAEGRAALDELCELAKTVSDERMAIVAQATAAVARVQQLGEGSRAWSVFVDSNPHVVDLPGGDLQLMKGLALLQDGDVAGALDAVEESIARGGSEGFKTNAAGVRALVRAAAGDHEGALAAIAPFDEGGTYLDRAWMAAARGFAARSVDDIDTALSIVDATGDRFDQALFRLARARLLLALGDPAGDVALADARGLFDAMGADVPGWDRAFCLASGSPTA